MKKITISIDNEQQLAVIEKLRGEKPAKEFAQACFDAGLKLIAEGALRRKNAIRFASAKPEFRTLDVAAITEALKDKDEKNPVKLEVGRLVKDYTTQLSEHAKKNGNRLPARLSVNAQSAIEKVAFQITGDVIKHAAKQAAEAKKTA